MRIKIYENSVEMTGYCKMAWLANIDYKVIFFKYDRNGHKINAYIIITSEEPEELSEREQLILEFWKEENGEKAAKIIEQFSGDAA